MDDGRPIFLQIAEQLESQIIDGSMREETQVPSINDLAVRMNDLTATQAALAPVLTQLAGPLELRLMPMAVRGVER